MIGPAQSVSTAMRGLADRIEADPAAYVAELRAHADMLDGLPDPAVVIGYAAAADYLGRSEEAVKKAVKRGRLASETIGRRRVFRCADLDARKLGLGAIKAAKRGER